MIGPLFPTRHQHRVTNPLARARWFPRRRGSPSRTRAWAKQRPNLGATRGSRRLSHRATNPQAKARLGPTHGTMLENRATSLQAEAALGETPGTTPENRATSPQAKASLRRG